MADSSAPTSDHAARRPRRQGRPAHEGLGVGRAAILEATLDLLKTVPPARMSVSAVGRAAGCDPALIRYYFGDLTSLLVAAASAISEDMHRKAEAALEDTSLAPRDRMLALIQIYLEVFVAHPFQHQLFVELILPRKGAAATALLDSVIGRVNAELREAMKGLPEPAGKPVDPVYTYTCIFGMLESFVAHRTIRHTLRPGADEAAEARAYAEFIVDRFPTR